MSKHITLPFYFLKERPYAIVLYFRRGMLPIVVLPVVTNIHSTKHNFIGNGQLISVSTFYVSAVGTGV